MSDPAFFTSKALPRAEPRVRSAIKVTSAWFDFRVSFFPAVLFSRFNV